MDDSSKAASRRPHAQMLRRNALAAVCGVPVRTSAAVNRSVDAEQPLQAVAKLGFEAVPVSLPRSDRRE